MMPFLVEHLADILLGAAVAGAIAVWIGVLLVTVRP